MDRFFCKDCKYFVSCHRFPNDKGMGYCNRAEKVLVDENKKICEYFYVKKNINSFLYEKEINQLIESVSELKNTLDLLI